MTRAHGEDTIFALSTGAPPAAIAIVRISGGGAADTLRSLIGELPSPRLATLRALCAGDGTLLDRALVLWFPGPATATGEDLAELHLHGGRAVVAAVLATLGAMPGCRPAQAGEFTRRAFTNERIDLAEAEGLADLLGAETESARRQALRHAEGGLSRLAERWRQQLLMLSARAEALLEFGDDEGDVAPDSALDEDIAALADTLAATLATPPAERLRDGFRVVIAGPPNAGKSTLINALAGRDAAITSPEAGTTRDLIEVPVQIDGLALLLIDSAGLRETDDRVERLGIARAGDAMASADLILWLGDEEAPIGPVMLLHARADEPGRRAAKIPGALAVSALTGEGLSALRELIIHRFTHLLPTGDGLLFNSRHRAMIGDAVAELYSGAAGSLAELRAEHLRHALFAIDSITGRAGIEDMLDSLFGRFCIGK